jgi:hypothetical protein
MVCATGAGGDATMLERIYNELFEEGSDRTRARPWFISVLAIYCFLNPVLYLVSIGQDRDLLNFGTVHDWRIALIYCFFAPLLGYLLWTLRVRTHVALYVFLIFEVVRGAWMDHWKAVFFGVAILIYALRGEVRALFQPRQSGARAVHR